MANQDDRIVLHGPKLTEKVEAANEINSEELPALTEEQLVLAAHYQIEPEDFARILAAGQHRDEQQLRRAARLLKLIDRILAKHHPGVNCRFLFSYAGKAYKMMLKKKGGREQIEYFTNDLIEDLVDAGRPEGLQMLEGIVASAVRRLGG